MKKKSIIPVFLILGILGGAAWWYYSREDLLPYIKATGTIEADVTDVSPAIPGLVEMVAAKEGQEVKEGDVIVKLNRDELVALRERDAMTVAKAEANLENLQNEPRPEIIAEAEANLANLRAGARPEELAQAEAAVKAAQIQVDQAESDLNRAIQLHEAGGLSDQELDALQSRFDASLAGLESAKAGYNLLLAGTRPDIIRAAEAHLQLLYAGSRTEVIEAAKADVVASKAVLEATDVMLQDLLVTSPTDGTVLSVNYSAGEYVQPGTSLVSIANLQHMYIKIYITTDDLPYVRLNQKVKVTITGMDNEFEGSIRYIASEGEYTPKTIQTEKERANVVYAIKVDIGNQGGLLKPGMPADVYISKVISND